MAGYTLINLRDVEDLAPKFGLAPGIEARFASDALRLERSGLSYQRLAPNFRAPFGHKHKEQEEIYVVLGGSGRVKLDDEIVELKRLDALRVAKATMRAFEAGPAGLEILAFGAPRAAGAITGEEVEMTMGWWKD